MGNCLVTKLKGVVDNDNLVELGHIHLTKINSGGFVIKPASGQPAITIKSINNESVNITIPPSYDSNTIYSAIDAAPIGTILDISGKYTFGEIDISNGVVDFSTDLFKYTPCTFWSSSLNGDHFYGDIANMAAATGSYGFRSLSVRNNNLSGDISCLIGKLTNFDPTYEMNLSNNPNLEGVLSADFLDFSGYKINIMGTKITTTQAVLDAFAAKNIQISYEQRQVIG